MELIDKESLATKLSQLIRYSLDNLNLDNLDGLYAHNQLIELFGVTEPKEIPDKFNGDLYSEILTPLSDYALKNGMIDEFGVERFKTKIMGYVMPSPSQVVDYFDTITANDGIKEATTWLYKLCANATYLNEPLLETNLQWNYVGSKGELIINVNCARPEKDPKEIALAKAMPQTNYPKCMLCKENIGYAGRINHPARQTLRFIPIKLDDGSTWYMQFSPYRYFEQHCILFSDEHSPMALGEKSFKRMLELNKNLPHYFVSSNAPLPIVGGSILSHDHYQGGSKVMTEFKSPMKMQFSHPDFPNVKFTVLDWYNSVIRIKSKDENQFVKAITFINDSWANYDDTQCNIISHTGDTPHNAITPVVHLERGDCVAELFLRNNRTDKDHPYGIFHPTEDMHFIKKEGIGVIEVMGTFVLPGRIAKIFNMITDIINGKTKFDEKELLNPANPLHPYRFLIVKLLTQVDKSNPFVIEKELHDFVSDICDKVIKCTAVFKDDENGNKGFERFMKSIGCQRIDAESTTEARKPIEETAVTEQNNEVKGSGRIYIPNRQQKRGDNNNSDEGKTKRTSTLRKQKEENNEDKVENVESTTEKAVKSVENATPVQEAPTEEPVKRKRGRPKKNP